MSEPTTVREVESKFAVSGDFVMPNLTLSGARDVVRQSPVTLTATYYDTDDLRLARFGATLRRRTGGRDAGWHLKLPQGVGVRDEVQLPLSSGRPGQVPQALSTLVLGMTRGAPLAALVTQRTRRTAINVTGRSTRGNRADLEVVDDVVTLTDGPLDGQTYREVEAEVLGSGDLLPIVSDLLFAAGARPSQSRSKGVRALAGDTPLEPVVPAVVRARPKDAAALAVTQHLRTHVAVLLAQDVRVRRNQPDAVHQFRVAARRLRSGLQAFAPLVDEAWARHLRAELGWIAGVLGASRDREVLEERLFAGIRRLPGDLDRAAALVAVQDHLEAELASANAEIEETMQSARYLTLLDTLVAAALQTPTTPSAEGPSSQVLPPLVNKRWKRLDREATVLHDEIQGHDDHWHQTRITAKKARYTVEACVPVFGGPARKLAKQLETVTELLGEHQDAAIAADTVHGLVTRATGPRAAFALGALYDQQRRRVQEVRHEFVECWPRISHSEWRKWLKAKA